MSYMQWKNQARNSVVKKNKINLTNYQDLGYYNLQKKINGDNVKQQFNVRQK